MRKVITIRTLSILLVILIAISGCETEKILFKGPYHIRFTEESITKKESFSEPIKIEVHIAGPIQSEDLTVNYGITGSARAGIDYTIVGDPNKVTIKKGEYFGYIEVHLINNANNILRSQTLVLTLQSASNSKLEVGQGPSAMGKTFTLTIQDDCILAGTYSGVQNVFDIPIEKIIISSTDCEKYTLSNWNINFFSPPYDYSLTFVDNGNNTITIPEQGDGATLEGKGIVEPGSNRIIFDLTLTYKDENDVEIEESYKFTLTPSL